jgi:hypothetical protein
MFHDGNIYYDKIKRVAVRNGQSYQLRQFSKQSTQKQEVQVRIEVMFSAYLQESGYFKEFAMSRTSQTSNN